MAAVTGAQLIGIDVAAAALAAARQRADQVGMASRATFHHASFDNTGLPSNYAHAVMSIDALLFAPSKHAAAAELARIIRPGGRLVATSWDYHTQPRGRPAQVADHRPLLDQAGFDVTSYEETCAWHNRQEQTGRALLAATSELAAETGEHPAERQARIAEMNATLACVTRRVLMSAKRRPQSS